MDDEEKSTLKYPKKCKDVWACVDVCPTGAIHKPKKK
jgi:ferredoxin